VLPPELVEVPLPDELPPQPVMMRKQQRAIASKNLQVMEFIIPSCPLAPAPGKPRKVTLLWD
jgi:hypothetical protein